MKILIIDNYDSFTYNLVQLIKVCGEEVVVIKNDAISEKELSGLFFDKLLISPGPGKPENAELSLSALKFFSGKKSILGVCLGHQVIYEYFGGKVIKAEKPVHGYTSIIQHSGRDIFTGIPENFSVMRYHSLIADPLTLPESLEVTASIDEDIIMAVKHREHDIYGVQFHPESILTKEGSRLIYNWMYGADFK